MLAHRIALIALLVLAALAAGATSASANVYCAGLTKSYCSGPQRPGTEAGLRAAIADAEADTDSSSEVFFGAPAPIAITSPISISASHPITLQGDPDNGIVAALEWRGDGPGPMISFDNSAAGGARGLIRQIDFWAGGDATALRIKSANVYWCDFAFGPGEPGDTTTAIAADGGSIISGGLFALGDSGVARRGIAVNGPDVRVETSRFQAVGDMKEGIVQTHPGGHVYFNNTFDNVANPVRVERGTGIVRDSTINLRATPGATAASAFNPTGASGSAEVVLDGTTVAGRGNGQTALRAASTDPTKPARAAMDSTLIDMRGAGALVATCALGPGGVGVAGIDATYSLFPIADDKRILDSGCTSGGADGNTNIDYATHRPVYAVEELLSPAESSPVVDAGNPSAMRGESDNRTIFSIGDVKRIDIGAREWSTSQVLRFGQAVGKFKLRKRAKAFRLTGANNTPRLPINLRLPGEVRLTLEKVGGWKKGRTCVSKKPTRKGKRKRCNIPLRGSQALKLPLGDSYLNFTGRWAGKKLKPGKYVVTAYGGSYGGPVPRVRIELVR